MCLQNIELLMFVFSSVSDGECTGKNIYLHNVSTNIEIRLSSASLNAIYVIFVMDHCLLCVYLILCRAR